MQAAKRTPVDLEEWATSMMERHNRKSHLPNHTAQYRQPASTSGSASASTSGTPTSAEIPIGNLSISDRDAYSYSAANDQQQYHSRSASNPNHKSQSQSQSQSTYPTPTSSQRPQFPTRLSSASRVPQTQDPGRMAPPPLGPLPRVPSPATGRRTGPSSPAEESRRQFAGY